MRFNLEPGFEKYSGSTDDMSHEAGYDSYMTGVVFLTMMKHIEVGRFIKNLEAASSKDKK